MEVLPGRLQQLAGEDISGIDGPAWDQGYHAEAKVDDELLDHIEQLVQPETEGDGDSMTSTSRRI